MKIRSGLLYSLVLVSIAALAYLPLIHKIGYTHDDWYLMSTARTHGAEAFHPIYSVDRPLRAYVLETEYKLFGENVLLYNLSAWLFRIASALLFLWLLGMLWPGQSRWTFLMALFYLLYPGFLSQQNGIDYQAQILSLALAMLSLGLTVHAFSETRQPRKLVEILLAIASGILYLGLVEYEAGFELIRLMILFLLVGRITHNFRDRMVGTLKAWLPYSLIILGFGIWRFFFFESERAATDATIQLGQLWLYPVQTIYHWTVQVVQDLLDVLVLAWAIPLSQLTGFIQWWGSLIAVVAALLVLLIFMRRINGEGRVVPAVNFHQEALWLGLLSAIAGLIPIAMVNREVAFPAFSRYALVSSVGAAILVVAILVRVNGRLLRGGILAGLVFIAVLTHHANAVKFARQTEVIRNFWWQVSWRVPQLEPRTTLIGNYPLGAIEEDYFLWGPANLIYYSDQQAGEGIGPTLYAAVLNKDTMAKVQARERQEYDNRKNIITYKNYRNILVLTRPALNSCVHLIDGLQPVFSPWETDAIRVVGPYSEIERVLVDEAPHAPPATVFGPEPEHGWCYYYQKADLARQRGDWEVVLALGEEALGKGLAPGDSIEWMPFLQAYAHTGNAERLVELAPQVTASPYVARQACRILGAMTELSESVIKVVNTQYCLE